jgi:hypothetical protein
MKTILFFDLPVSLNKFKTLCKYHDVVGNKQYMFGIKEGLFLNKINNEKISEWWDVRENVRNFYDEVEKLKDGGADGKLILYRNISTNIDKKFHPENYRVGDVIEQIIPISTSIEPEFPVYVWSDKRACCLLKIKIKQSKLAHMLCLQPLNKLTMVEKMFVEKSFKMYQSEVTLGPGKMVVRKVKKLIVPSKEEYRKYVLDNKIYGRKVSRYLESIQSDGNPDDFEGFEQTLIEVDYIPYSMEDFEENIFKYSEEYIPEEKEEIIEWA